MPGAQRLDHIRNIAVGDPICRVLLVGIHRQPVTLLGVAVEHAVAGEIDQQVVARAEFAARLGQRTDDVGPAGIDQQIDVETVLPVQQLRHAAGIVDRRLELGMAE